MRRCRPVRGPDHDGQRVSRQRSGRRRLEARGAAPIGHFEIGEAKTAVSVIITQKFKLMRREVDKDENAAVYGPNASAQNILNGRAKPSDEAAGIRAFTDALAKYAHK